MKERVVSKLDATAARLATELASEWDDGGFLGDLGGESRDARYRRAYDIAVDKFLDAVPEAGIELRARPMVHLPDVLAINRDTFFNEQATADFIESFAPDGKSHESITALVSLADKTHNRFLRDNPRCNKEKNTFEGAIRHITLRLNHARGGD